MKSTPKHQKSTRRDRFSYIIDDQEQLAIPIGPRFQADVPEWTGPPHKNSPYGAFNKSDSSKWLGTMIWSMKNTIPEVDGDVIGKGRPESCRCVTHGTIQCVKRHVAEKTVGLQKSLGPAFKKWKFDQMGEGVAKLWKQPEQQRLTHLMKTCPLSGQEFIKPALECFPLKAKKDIVNFYFNVYIPRRMSIQTRSGCMMIDTDEEEEEELNSRFKGSRKKARIDGVNVCSPKLVKARYLTQRR
ncbi:hypothetical protein SSX86_013230 [Deinandra increscens subsp. villosa]|uniref:ELM2 domain-containing protein n=1 Tax=Deinandra increscens subsp. villosa TaxID=3103831 RepID=A0AAP0DD88_9ASTR